MVTAAPTRALLLCLLLGAGACGPQPAAERGAALARDPGLSESPSNVYACTTCHAVSADEGALRLPGYPLAGAARRPRLWGGEVTYLLDAVNLCVAEFMRGDRMGADDPRGLALLAYLQELSPAAEPARPLTIVRTIDDGYLGALPQGDGARGEASYRAACAYCHGDKDSGAGRLGPRVSLLPGDTIKSFGAQARAVTAEKVRHGKFFGISGVMPLFAQERLSDGELADVLRYLFP